MDGEFYTQYGKPIPYGVTYDNNGFNFAVFVSGADYVLLQIYFDPNSEPYIFPMFSTGSVYHVWVNLQNINKFQYNFQISRNNIIYELADPYCNVSPRPNEWGNSQYLNRSLFVQRVNIDWENDQPPNLNYNDLIIYEMHVRGFTMEDNSIPYHHRGTFQGIIDKIDYLKYLGITAIELLPIFDFNENEGGKELKNYWGYQPINFFSLHNAYCSVGEDGCILEFQNMVKILHQNNIEVILDVVYNHTGYDCSLLGLAPKQYYIVKEEEKTGNFHHLDFSGCGNTVNCNHPITKELIMNSLRYWVINMHVDGFRFDEGTILLRNLEGNEYNDINNSPIIEEISLDPILQNIKLILEPWDAGGLFKEGCLKYNNRWMDWNGNFRDDIRQFIVKNEKDYHKIFASRIGGSKDIYGSSLSPHHSINFVTCHDGFSMMDLLCYNTKHNEMNLENNRDGSDNNYSDNNGVEGVEENERNNEILSMRLCKMKNLFIGLLLSRGVVMIKMGDEYCHTHYGNNNPYNQDNYINYFHWDLINNNNNNYNKEMINFVRKLIKFRKENSAIHLDEFVSINDIEWYNKKGENTIYWDNEDNSFLSFSYKDSNKKKCYYVAFNNKKESDTIVLPEHMYGDVWFRYIDSCLPFGYDINEEMNEYVTDEYEMNGYSSIVLISIGK